jgi:hypothetical protein
LTASDASLVEELRRLRVGRDPCKPHTDVDASDTSEQSWAEESFETVFAAPTKVDHSASFSKEEWLLKHEWQPWSKHQQQRPSRQHSAFRPILLTATTGGPIASTDVKALFEGDGDSLPMPLLSKWTGAAGAVPAATSVSFSTSNLQPLTSAPPAARLTEGTASPTSSSDLELSMKQNWRDAIAQCRILQQVSWAEHFGAHDSFSDDSDSDNAASSANADHVVRKNP